MPDHLLFALIETELTHGPKHFLSDLGKKSTVTKVNCVSVLSDRIYGSVLIKIKCKTRYGSRTQV